MKTHCPYHTYYLNQAGSGSSVIYRGAAYQRGHGIGSFLGGIFRSILPFLKSGAKTVGRELLRGSAGFLGDLSADQPARESLKKRVREVGSNLKRKATDTLSEMTGSGNIKRGRISKNCHTRAKRRSLSIKTQKQSRDSDIFG